MDALGHELHAAFRGEGYEWDPPLDGAAVAGLGLPEGGEPLTALALAAFASPAGWSARVVTATGAGLRLERHDASALHGVRGGVVRVLPDETAAAVGSARDSGPATAPDPATLASLLAELRRSAGGPVALLPPLWRAAIGGDAAIARMFVAAARPLPSLLVLDPPGDLRARVEKRPGAPSIALAVEPPATDAAALRLARWIFDGDRVSPWSTVRALVPPPGDAPLGRYVAGSWSAEADDLLDGLTRLGRDVVGWAEARAAVSLLRSCERVLGAPNAAVAVHPVSLAGRPPTLHITPSEGVARVVLELPIGTRSLEDHARSLELARLAGDDALAWHLASEFRRASIASPVGSAGWWYARGAPIERVRERAVEETIPPQRTAQLLAEVEGMNALAPAERDALLGPLLLAVAFPDGGSPPAPADLARAAAVLGSRPLALLAAALDGKPLDGQRAPPRQEDRPAPRLGGWLPARLVPVAIGGGLALLLAGVFLGRSSAMGWFQAAPPTGKLATAAGLDGPGSPPPPSLDLGAPSMGPPAPPTLPSPPAPDRAPHRYRQEPH